MRVLAFSDLHANAGAAAELTRAASEADLVIGAGDFCNMRRGLAEAMALLSGITRPMLIVPGNAESEAELQAAILPSPHITLLHGNGVKIDGVEFFGLGYGVPLTPFGDWSCDLTEAEAETMLSSCPEGAVMILHSPPQGVVDRMSSGRRIGSTAIHDAIERRRPRLALCGHVHESWGESGMIGETPVHNLGPTVNWFEL